MSDRSSGSDEGVAVVSGRPRYRLLPEFSTEGETFDRVLASRRDVHLTAVNLDVPRTATPGSVWILADIAPCSGLAGWWWMCTMKYATGILSLQQLPVPGSHVPAFLECMDVPSATFRLEACEATSFHPWTPPKGKVNADREAKRLVYFIQPIDGGLVKIGVAANPKSRLKLLQTGCPVDLRILGLMPGGQPMESELHARFAEHRVRGEWFEPTAELLSLIGQVPA